MFLGCPEKGEFRASNWCQTLSEGAPTAGAGEGPSISHWSRITVHRACVPRGQWVKPSEDLDLSAAVGL